MFFQQNSLIVSLVIILISLIVVHSKDVFKADKKIHQKFKQILNQSRDRPIHKMGPSQLYMKTIGWCLTIALFRVLIEKHMTNKLTKFRFDANSLLKRSECTFL